MNIIHLMELNVLQILCRVYNRKISPYRYNNITLYESVKL